MPAKFQNFVFEVFDLELDAQYGDGCGSSRVHTKSHNYRSPNRIAVERIGHSRHWRVRLHTSPPRLPFTTPRCNWLCKHLERRNV